MERRAGVYTHREHLFGEPARHKVLAHRQVVSQDVLSAPTHTAKHHHRTFTARGSSHARTLGGLLRRILPAHSRFAR